MECGCCGTDLIFKFKVYGSHFVDMVYDCPGCFTYWIYRYSEDDELILKRGYSLADFVDDPDWL